MLEFGHMVSTDEIFECRTHTPIRLNLALNGNIAGPLPAKIGKPCAENAKIVKAENRGNEAWSAVKTNTRSHGAANCPDPLRFRVVNGAACDFRLRPARRV